MTERFSQGLLDRIIGSTDVAGVIGRYTSLKRRGNKLVGLCPFHKEKTPSFTVDSEKGLYYCFGCHAGGSVFNFIMEKEGLTFYQAVEFLAREAGIEIPKIESSGGKTEGLYEAAEFSAMFFRKAFKADIGRASREYVLRRGISYETAEKFQIGWAPADQNHLVTSIEKAKLDFEPFVVIGVVGKSNSGRYFAKISDALVFPISTSSGRVVGFAHRRIQNDPNYTGPKYINSADNDIYNKSAILYGLPQARSSIRSEGKSLLVEGYFDVIALAEKGITNTAASCGTALTSEQANLLARFAPRTVVLYDGDNAGLRATHRSLEILLSAGLDVFVARLPEDEDPDSFVLKNGPDKLTDIISKAPEWFDWLYRSARAKTGGGISAVSDIIDELAIPLGSVSDEMKRNLYVRELSVRLGVSEESLRDHLRKAYRKQRHNYSSEPDNEKIEDLPDNAKIELSLIASIVSANKPVQIDENPLTLYKGLWEKAVAGASGTEILSEISDQRARGYLSEAFLLAREGDESTVGVLLFKLMQSEADRIDGFLQKLDDHNLDDEEGTKLLRERAEIVRKIKNIREKYIK